MNARQRAAAEEMWEAQASKYCYECGQSDLVVTFRSELARRCDICHARAQKEHQAFQRAYSKARYWATARLVEAYKADFKALLDEELDKVRDAEGNIIIDVEKEEEEELERAS